MKIAISCLTPAQVYFYSVLAKEFQRQGHEVKLLISSQPKTLQLATTILKEHSWVSFGTYTKNKVGKLSTTITNILTLIKILKHYNTDLCIGQLPMIYAARWLGKPCVTFEDDECTYMQHLFYKPLVKKIVTPFCFEKDFGKKHVRVKAFKETIYLKDFQPEDVPLKKPYVILRLNTWDASHDVGRKGIDFDSVVGFICDVESKGVRVYISTEKDLPENLKECKLPLAANQIHSALYHASLVVTDTATMATEAALLGTPVVRLNIIKEGNFNELDKRKLIHNFDSMMFLFNDAHQLLAINNLKLGWAPKVKQFWDDYNCSVKELAEVMLK